MNFFLFQPCPYVLFRISLSTKGHSYYYTGVVPVGYTYISLSVKMQALGIFFSSLKDTSDVLVDFSMCLT